MAAFISYNSQDRQFAELLALKLVQDGHNVWIDKWELSVGDSLIDRIQQAISEASAVVAILSRTSVQSDWCKKEINSALIRELDKSGSLLLPCVIDDCPIPLFLQEKVYADFKSDPSVAFKQLSGALRRWSNKLQSRMSVNNNAVDYGFSHGDCDHGLRFAEWTFIEHCIESQFTVLTVVRAFCDEAATVWWSDREKRGLAHIFLATTLQLIHHGMRKRLFLIDGPMPQTYKMTLRDKSGFEVDVVIEVRRVGLDNGKSTLVPISEYIENAIASQGLDARIMANAASR